MSTRVILVEDHTEIRNGLVFLINNSSDYSCLGFADAESACYYLENHVVDVILLDIKLPGMSGIEFARLLRQKHPDIQIIMCTVYEDDEKIFEALAAGANGYLLKKSSPLEIIDAIKDVLNGSAPMSGQIARKVVNFFQRKSAITSHDLSARESEILNLLADGFSNKEIAEKLFVSVHTIRNHLYKIYEKLQVHSRVEAVNKLRNFTKL